MRHDNVEQSEAAEATVERPWWHCATICEIALISFQDSNGDGKGDLAGLLSRVDYLKWLGVDAVWLTPIYKSPFRDLGYDISMQELSGFPRVSPGSLASPNPGRRSIGRKPRSAPLAAFRGRDQRTTSRLTMSEAKT